MTRHPQTFDTNSNCPFDFGALPRFFSDLCVRCLSIEKMRYPNQTNAIHLPFQPSEIAIYRQYRHIIWSSPLGKGWLPTSHRTRHSPPLSRDALSGRLDCRRWRSASVKPWSTAWVLWAWGPLRSPAMSIRSIHPHLVFITVWAPHVAMGNLRHQIVDIELAFLAESSLPRMPIAQ